MIPRQIPAGATRVGDTIKVTRSYTPTESGRNTRTFAAGQQRYTVELHVTDVALSPDRTNVVLFDQDRSENLSVNHLVEVVEFAEVAALQDELDDLRSRVHRADELIAQAELEEAEAVAQASRARAQLRLSVEDVA